MLLWKDDSRFNTWTLYLLTLNSNISTSSKYQMTCYEMWENISWDEISWLREQLLNLNVIQYDHTTSPFLRLGYMANNLLGMYVAVHYDKKVCGQSGSIVPRSPGPCILVPCRHGQIFMAAQVWHGMLQALVLGHSSEQLAWQEQLEPVSSGLPVLQVSQMWAACVVQVGVMQVVLLRSGVLSEPAVWQWCHWDSVSCLDTAFMEVSPCMAVCGTITGVYLIAVPWEGAHHSSRNPNLPEGVVCCNWLTSIQWCKCFAAFVSLCLSRFRACVNLLMDLCGWWIAVAYLGQNGHFESALIQQLCWRWKLSVNRCSSEC